MAPSWISTAKVLPNSSSLKPKKCSQQQQVAGRRHRNVFGEALDDAEEGRLDDIEKHGSSGASGATWFERRADCVASRARRAFRPGGARGQAQLFGAGSSRRSIAWFCAGNATRCAGSIVDRPRIVKTLRSLYRLRSRWRLRHLPAAGPDPMMTLLPSPVLSAFALRAHRGAANTASPRGSSRSAPWERREEFLALNPAGTTPVLTEEGRAAGAGRGDHRGISRRDPRRLAQQPSAAARRHRRPRRGAPADELVQRQVLCRGERPAAPTSASSSA